MCGIIFAGDFKNFAPVSKPIEIQYQHQKERGTEGYGMIAFRPNEPSIISRATNEEGLLATLQNETSPFVLFHHRFPTSTPNTLQTTHPIRIDRDDKSYFIVHNGMIQNAHKMHKKHIKQGIKYSTEEQPSVFNDSECLAHELVAVLRGERKECRAVGSAAYMILETTPDLKPSALYLGRNTSNPLNIYKSNGFLLIASEAQGGYPLPPNILFSLDMKTGKLIEKQALTIQVPVWYYEKPKTSASKHSPMHGVTDLFDGYSEADYDEPANLAIQLASLSTLELEAELEAAEVDCDELYYAAVLAELEHRYQYYTEENETTLTEEKIFEAIGFNASNKKQ